MIERMIHAELHEDYILDKVNDETLFYEKLKDPRFGVIFLGTKPNQKTFDLLEKISVERKIMKVVLLSEDDYDSMDFYLELKFDLVVESPFEKDEVRHAIHQIINEKEAAKNVRVLLVDDTTAYLEFAQKILEDEGLKVTCASNGLEALQIIQERKILFDLIITDLGMPKMNGVELIQRLKVFPLTRSIPIICSTSQTNDDVEIEALKAGAIDFIFKPFKKEVLLTRSMHHIQAFRDREGLQVEVDRQTMDLKESRKQALISMGQALSANKSKSEFISNMSHELRTPLNGILGAAEIMKGTCEGDETEEWITMIQHNGHNLLNIINNILDFSKMDTGDIELEMHKFSIHQMVHSLEREFSKDMISKGLEFKYKYPEEMAEYLRSDPGRLKQILNNLIDNAVKFTGEGKVSIKIEMDLQFEESFLMVHVIDTGRGMTENQVEYLFEAFTQAEDSLTKSVEGTGLGLSISKGLAKVMGGDITVKSQLGEGSDFCLRIPVQEVNEETSNTLVQDIPSTGLYIFGLGQKESLEYRFPCVFELENYKPVMFEKTDALMRHLDLHPVSCPLILIDESFENSNSLEVGKQILDFEPSARCIFTTQEGFRGQSKLVSDYGFAAYLTGIISEDDFDSLIHKLLKSDLKRTLTKYDISKPSKGHVLLVEDNSVTQKIALKLLNKMNIECDIAENGKIGCEQFFKKKYDLVLMDLNMPEMDGFEATQAIHEKQDQLGTEHKKVPIVAFTSNSNAENKRLAEQVGMSAFISKPISKEKIDSLISEMLKQK
jgi:signal transduction histidine kinase